MVMVLCRSSRWVRTSGAALVIVGSLVVTGCTSSGTTSRRSSAGASRTVQRSHEAAKVGSAPVTPTTTTPSGCEGNPTVVPPSQNSAWLIAPQASARIDARTAEWSNVGQYPVWFEHAGSGVCWIGGHIDAAYPPTTPWSFYHGSASFGFGGPKFTVSGIEAFNYGDGIDVRAESSGFQISSVHLSYMHDDCIQDRFLYSGVVSDSFLDGCYVAFAARPVKGDTRFDGRANTYTIRDSLVRLQAMPTVFKGGAPGTGGFFKWDDSGRSPMLEIDNTVFRADQLPNHQTLGLPAGYQVTCKNNVMVWLGRGPFPETLPSCFTITTDRRVWDRAVTAWRHAHPPLDQAPEVTMARGQNSGTGALFTVSLSASAKSPISVYYTSTPGGSTSGVLTFQPGETSKTLPLPGQPGSPVDLFLVGALGASLS